MNDKKNIQLSICILIVLSFFSCGDLFNDEKQIADKYYLVETGSKDDIAIYYKTSYGD